MATQRAAEDIVGYSALAKRSCEGEWRRTSQAYTGGEHRALPDYWDSFNSRFLRCD